MSSKYERKQRRREAQRKRQESQAANDSPSAPRPADEAVDGVDREKERDEGADSTNTNQTRDRKKVWPSRQFTVITELFVGVFIAVFTGAQVVYGVLQWYATEKQWSAMEQQLDSMWLDQRPWLCVHTPEAKELQAGEPMRCVVVVTNSGKTPAFIHEVTVMGEVMEMPPGDFEIGLKDLNFLDDKLSRRDPVQRNAVAPGGNFITTIDSPERFDQSKIDQIKGGRLALVLAIRLDYADIKGIRHRTVGCFQYSVTNNRFIDTFRQHMD